MAQAYTKEFLTAAFFSRYSNLQWTEERWKAYQDMISKQYDKVGKDKFRVYASLDAEAIRKYKNSLLKK